MGSANRRRRTSVALKSLYRELTSEPSRSALGDVKVRDCEEDADKKQDRDCDDPQPDHHELTLILVLWRRRYSKHQRESAKNIRQRPDHVSVFAHLFTATFKLDVHAGG